MRRLFGAGRFALDATLDLLWPTPCPLCKQELARTDPGVVRGPTRGLFHEACLRRLPREPEDPTPARPWPGPVPVQAWLRDEPELFGLLHRAKYGGERALLTGLGRGWAEEHAARFGAERALLVPLPDEAGRRRRRGYGVTLELARALAAVWGWPVHEGLLRRRPGGTPQAHQTDDEARRRNVAGRFAVGRLSEISSDRVLVLVEDQVTTGATIAAALASLGARGHRLRVLALAASARAPRGVGP